MDRALLLLIWLRFRGAVRRMFRRVRGVRGAVALAAGVLLFLSWLMPSLLMLIHRRVAPAAADEVIRQAVSEPVLRFGPAILLAVCLLPLLTGQAASLVFAPAEVDFLFAGPFTRRRLILYKVVTNALGAAALAVFMSLMVARMAGHWLSPYPFTFLALVLTQLFSMLLAVLGAALGSGLYKVLRNVLLVILLAGVAAVAWFALGSGSAGSAVDAISGLIDSPPARVILAPFTAFILMLAATTPAGVALWALAAVAVNLALFFLIVRLDRFATEAAINASERYAALRERAARVPGGAASGWIVTRWTFPWPAPPAGWLGGAGPIAWRQLNTCLRGSPGWLLSTLIMLACVLGFGFWTRLGKPLPPGILGVVGIQVLVMLTIFQTMMLRFDFRADLDRMESIKSLPLPPLAVAAGQMLTPVLFMTLSQWLLAVAGAALFSDYRAPIFVGALAAPGVNALLVGVENLMFLLYPARPPSGPVLELQRIGRGTFITIAKYAITALAAGAVAGVSAAAYFLAGRSWAVAIAAGWLTLAGVAAVLVLAVSSAFRRFDVSRDIA